MRVSLKFLMLLDVSVGMVLYRHFYEVGRWVIPPIMFAILFILVDFYVKEKEKHNA